MGEFSTRIDLAGQRFGKWEVIRFSHHGKDSYWECRCDCGNIALVGGRTLRKGLSKSCGCRKAEITSKTHRKEHTIVDGIEHKQCYKCNQYLPLNDFVIDNSSWDKFSHICKPCKRLESISRPKNREYFRNWANNKYKTDVHFRIKSSIQARIRAAIKNNYKYYHTDELLGCSIQELKKYLEEKFIVGMSWDNYGKWHIDHIIPCALFDLSKASEQKKCFHYSNLQPLWEIDNIRKKDKVL